MYPIIAALSQVGGILLDKIILTRRQVSVNVYIPVLFLFLCLLTGILYPFLGKVNQEFINPYFISSFLFMIATAIIWNFFYYKGVQSEKVHEYELIIMFQPLLTILLAALVFPAERNVHIIIASIVASVALIVSHLKKNHFSLTDGAWNLVWAVVFMSIELIFLKVLLEVYSPVALYFFRTGIIFIFFYIWYRPHLNKVSPVNIWLITSTSLLGVVQMVAKFYGFEKYGIIYTSLILIASPILVYILSTIFLHERIKIRQALSFVVILICIVYATIIGK
jgi:drug/metabolite transporter (DMT)-like permease